MSKDQTAQHEQPQAEAVECAVDLRQLVADHHALVYRYAYRLTGNQADAEDVAQQTFLTAQQNLHQLRQPENPVPWLLAIARSCWIKSRRRRRPVAGSVLDMDMESVPGPLPEGEEIDHEQLQSALDQIGDEFKLVLVMFYFEEKSYKEIAADLEIPIGTVMSRLARAKSHLRRHLAGDVQSDNPVSKSQITNHESQTTFKSQSSTTPASPGDFVGAKRFDD